MASSRTVARSNLGTLPCCKREGSQAVAGGAGETSRPSRRKPRLVCLVRILEMQNLQYRAKALQTRRLPNGGDVGAGNDERRETMAGRGGRAVPRDQAQGQAQGQAVAAGTSSRLSLLMLCGRNYIYV